MKDPRKDWNANHVIAWGGAMSPYRLHAQVFKPEPLPEPNRFQKLMRKLFRVTEPTYREPFFNDPDKGL